MLTTILLDIDKTTTNTHRQITPRTQTAIIDAQKKGYQVAFCTGRQLLFITHFFDFAALFPVDQPHILSGGAQIVTTKGQILWENLIPASLVAQLFALAWQTGTSLVSTSHNQIVTNSSAIIEHFLTEYSNISRQQLLQVAADFQADLPLLVCEHLRPAFTEFFHEQSALDFKMMVNYQGESYADLTAHGVNKGQAIKVWAELQQVPLSQIAMVGDSANDVEALSVVGYPVAMGNALDSLKTKARLVLDHTDRDGLAQWLESLPVLTQG